MQFYAPIQRKVQILFCNIATKGQMMIEIMYKCVTSMCMFCTGKVNSYTTPIVISDKSQRI